MIATKNRADFIRSVFCHIFGEGGGEDTLQIGNGKQTFHHRCVGSKYYCIPLILGALAGFAAVLLRQLAPSVFDLPQTLPSVYKVCGDLSRAASPLVLVILGARLRFDAVQGLWKKITAAVAMRLVVVPGIVLTLAVLLRDPLGITAEEMPTVVAIFCSPVAVTSAVMVQEMGGDEQLAQQVVAWSSALSMVTIFCFAAGLRAMGVM